jgi:hypothetical protein
LTVPTKQQMDGVAVGELQLDDMTRLYRAEPAPSEGNIPDWIKQEQDASGHTEAKGRWFVTDPTMLDWYKEDIGPNAQPFQHVTACIIMSQGNGLRCSELPRQGCIPRHVLVPLPALGPMPVPTRVVPGSSTVLRNSSLSHVSR